VRNIAHRLKIVRFLEWSGQGFYRVWGGICTEELCSRQVFGANRFF
jgi:hypothetical protein